MPLYLAIGHDKLLPYIFPLQQSQVIPHRNKQPNNGTDCQYSAEGLPATSKEYNSPANEI
jgi:hypothetical protein